MTDKTQAERIAEARLLVEATEGHTSGPWQRIGGKNCGIYDNGHWLKANRIALMEGHIRQDADARLIVAAPDMRNAITDLLALIEEKDAALLTAADDLRVIQVMNSHGATNASFISTLRNNAQVAEFRTRAALGKAP